MDIPLQFHEFHHLNHLERCPKFSDILKRNDPVTSSDLDSLYTDLETLQGASNIRLRRLEDEMKILTEWCDKKDRSKGDVDLEFLNTVSSIKRSRQGTTDDGSKVSSKKQKYDDSSKAGSSKKKSKGKLSHEGNDEANVSKPKLNFDAPNKFWSCVEPYCTDISTEDIGSLESMLTGKVEINEYFKIPPLGKHYSEVWAKEDFIDEQQQSGKLDKKRNVNIDSDNIEKKINKADINEADLETEDFCPYGTFTQRLVAALVDENIMAPMTGNEIQEVKGNEHYKIPGKFSKKHIPCAKSLEVAIKEELFSLGLIDSANEDDMEYDADDEILSELQKCQSELKALRAQNKSQVNKLIQVAKIAIQKQEVKQKAKIVDAELVDIFRRFSSSKIKKKGLSRKDRELAWKALREREAIWKLVDNSEATTSLSSEETN